MSRRPGRPGALAASLLAVAALVLLPAGRAAADGPTAAVDRAEAGKGGSVTVTGTGWRPGALLTLLICGQNMVGGTNDCANADGRAVRVGDDGRFGRKLPVAEPPKPCPCVVHVATVTGERAAADAAFRVAGHPVEPLPRQTGRERLSVLGARLEGSSGLLTWFGAPPRRKLVVTVGNLGPTPARDPVFRVGTAHGVLAPAWEEQRWRGTVAAGAKARVALDVELSAGAHGDYVVSLEYGGKLLVEQPWAVPRPWGVTLFWALLCVVVPATVFRAAMAAVAAAARRRDGPATGGTDPARRHRAVRAPRGWTRAPSRPPGAGRGAATGAVPGPGAGRSPDAGALPEPGAGTDAVRGPGAATDAAPGVGPGTEPRAGVNPAPGTGVAADAGAGTGTGSGAAGPDTCAGANRAPGKAAAPVPGADIGASPDPGRATGPESDPGAGPRSGPCGGLEAGSGADAVPGPGGRSRPGAATDAAPGVGTGTGTGSAGPGTGGGANPGPGRATGAEPGPGAGPGLGGGSGPAPHPIAAREGLPWFGADTQPRVSAPSEDGPTKGTT